MLAWFSDSQNSFDVSSSNAGFMIKFVSSLCRKLYRFADKQTSNWMTSSFLSVDKTLILTSAYLAAPFEIIINLSSFRFES